MKAIKIIDLMKKEKPFDFAGNRLIRITGIIDIILITGITESNLNKAITIAESARESGVVTVGIPAGNDDIRRFSDVSDAAILTSEKTEGISQRIAEELSAMTERDSHIFDIRTITEIFRNAGTVHYGSGSGNDIESAIRKAAEMCGDIHGAKRVLCEIVTPKGAASTDEFHPGGNTLKDICGDDVYIFSIRYSNEEGKFTAKIFAFMDDAGYRDWKELFANESADNITAMIENGLDERTRKRLGAEEAFFAACMRFGTPELVKKFISKGHNPKELETDGIFPEDILADCLSNGVDARNTSMTDILFESGISLGENCVKALVPLLRNPEILQAFINYGWNVNSRDEDGVTFLAYAAAECSYECVKLLVEAGANINARDKDGYTPMMMIDFGWYHIDTAHEILKYFLANGAYINASADDGATVLTQAARRIYARPDIVRTILNAGASVNVEFTDYVVRRTSVLDIMFEEAVSVTSEPEEIQTFLRKVLPMMINAGAKINLTETRAFIDDRYKHFCQNWKTLLTERANIHAFRFFCDSLAEYDTETIREIIERISLEEIIPVTGEAPAKYIRKSARLVFRINDFPEAVSKPSAQHTEIKRRLEKGAEILRILKEAGIKWPIITPEGTELTYVIKEFGSPRRNIDEINPLCLCHSPAALKKVIASGKFDTTNALREIAANCEEYYQPVEMMNILLANGADIHIFSDADTWIGKCLSRKGELLMLNNFQQVKFMAEILRKHNPSDIITVKNTRYYDGWKKYCGGALNCHMLSHLWELIESGTDNSGKWVKFRDVMMLLSACWGSVNDIEDSINHGGNVNYSTWLGYTPLMYAAIFNKSESVKFLIKNGADINARNIHNQNATMLAVTSDYKVRDSEVIRVLAEFGADIHDGLMSLALDCANVNAVKVLLSLGVKLPEEKATNDPDPVTSKEKPCPKCGRIFSRENDYCPSCGYVLPVSERYTKCNKGADTL